jgi:hypothetical protein
LVFFSVLVCCTEKNLATLESTQMPDDQNERREERREHDDGHQERQVLQFGRIRKVGVDPLTVNDVRVSKGCGQCYKTPAAVRGKFSRRLCQKLSA